MSGGPRPNTLEVAPRSGPAQELVGKKVLIVDDDRTNLLLVRDALSLHGYTFFEAHDGNEALSQIRLHRPDLIVMDVQMPGLGGVEVCRIVKANQGDGGFGFVPVILMTGSTTRGAGKVESLELGADDYLSKPLDLLELSARVKSMLRLKALHDALIEKNRELDRANKELDRKREELLALSRTDGLTGLFNRRFFNERLVAEFARSERYRAPISLVMLDIDHFKRLNDRYGHPFGDLVLQQVAEVSRRTVRAVDVLARYGGEELIALLPESGPEDALFVAERLREEIEALRLRFVRADGSIEPVSVTASVGVASFPVPEIDSLEALLRAADDALYVAKGSGRNRVRRHAEG